MRFFLEHNTKYHEHFSDLLLTLGQSSQLGAAPHQRVALPFTFWNKRQKYV